MRKKAFTLIELLVVIAIIALLLAILLPSLMIAKEQARGIYCRSNLKQMCLAATSYTLDNNDYYPIAHYTQQVSVASGPSNGSNLCVITPEDPPQETMIYSYCWDFTTIKRGTELKTIPGVLWQGEIIEKVQQCPSYKGDDNWAGNQYTGYNYNTSYIGHGQGESVDVIKYRALADRTVSTEQPIVLPAKASFVKNPTLCALFGDGLYAGGANKFMRSPMTWEGDMDWSLRQAGTQGFRHNRRTNIGWADGHVSNQKEYYIETHPKYKRSLEAYNRTNKIKIGFIGPSNSLYDLK